MESTGVLTLRSWRWVTRDYQLGAGERHEEDERTIRRERKRWRKVGSKVRRGLLRGDDEARYAAGRPITGRRDVLVTKVEEFRIGTARQELHWDTLVVGDRLLFKGGNRKARRDAKFGRNSVYEVTAVGDASTPWETERL
jgi:hypothetical protein